MENVIVIFLALLSHILVLFLIVPTDIFKKGILGWLFTHLSAFVLSYIVVLLLM